MALTQDFITFGAHSMVPYRISDSLPYGIFKIFGGGTIALSAEFEDLFGGSNKYAWASEPKTISSEFTSSVKSMPDFLFELFLGASVSTTAASALGTVDAIVNYKGTSVVDASTGIATATALSGSETDLKAGTYVVVATGAATVAVYAMTDVDFGVGNNLEFVNDDLKITASDLTIVASTPVTIPNTGVELTGGAGVIGMTTGDTAVFQVAPAHGGISDVIIGQSTSSFPEHGEFVVAAKRSNGDIFEMDLHSCVGAGFPIALEETVFAIQELTLRLLYNASLNRIATFRKIRGANVS